MKKKQIKSRAETAKWVNDVTLVTIDDEHTAHVHRDKTDGFYAEVIHKSGVLVINEDEPRGSWKRNYTPILESIEEIYDFIKEFLKNESA